MPSGLDRPGYIVPLTDLDLDTPDTVPLTAWDLVYSDDGRRVLQLPLVELRVAVELDLIGDKESLDDFVNDASVGANVEIPDADHAALIMTAIAMQQVRHAISLVPGQSLLQQLGDGILQETIAATQDSFDAGVESGTFEADQLDVLRIEQAAAAVVRKRLVIVENRTAPGTPGVSAHLRCVSGESDLIHRVVRASFAVDPDVVAGKPHVWGGCFGPAKQYCATINLQDGTINVQMQWDGAMDGPYPLSKAAPQKTLSAPVECERNLIIVVTETGGKMSTYARAKLRCLGSCLQQLHSSRRRRSRPLLTSSTAADLSIRQRVVEVPWSSPA